MDVQSGQLNPETFTPLLKKLVFQPEEFGAEESSLALRHLLRPACATPVQVSSFLTALHINGVHKRTDVLAAAARVLLQHSVELEVEGSQDETVDIVGTGGDGWDTFNVSTTAAIVAAGAGARMVKHGNKAATSKTGSADLLRALSCPLLPLSPIHFPAATSNDPFPRGRLARPLPNIPFLFLLASDYHPALSNVAPIRKMLPFRTIFNNLGPLVNPSRPRRMIVGVAEPWLGNVFAHALRDLGVERALVVCGNERLDEISCAGDTSCWQLHSSGEITTLTLHPRMFGLPTHPLSEVIGGDSEKNAIIFKSLLDPDVKEDSTVPESQAILDFVLINAGAALVIAGKADDWKEGADLARRSIVDGKAWDAFVQFRKASQCAAKELDALKTIRN